MSKTITKILAQKIDGQPLRFEGSERRKFDEFQDQLPAGCYEVTIRKAKRMKTNQQVKTIFGLLINSVVAKANDNGWDTRDFLRALVNTDIPSGNGLTTDFLYPLFLTVCPITDDDGKRVTLSKMSTVQASKFFDECRNLIATSINLDIEDPDKNWKEEKK